MSVSSQSFPCLVELALISVNVHLRKTYYRTFSAGQDAPKGNCFDACRGPFFASGKMQKPMFSIGEKQIGNIALGQRSLSRICVFLNDLLARKKRKNFFFVRHQGGEPGRSERDRRTSHCGLHRPAPHRDCLLPNGFPHDEPHRSDRHVSR